MIQINEERLLKEFLEFVQIDSESCNEKAMGERLCQVLKELGLEPITDEAGKTYNSNGFNVFARLPGEGEPMVLTAHMDTVVPATGSSLRSAAASSTPTAPPSWAATTRAASAAFWKPSGWSWRTTCPTARRRSSSPSARRGACGGPRPSTAPS